MTVHNPPPADLTEPPPPTRTVLTVGLIGVGLVLLAFVIGLATNAPRRGFDPHPWDGPRALLSALGLFVAGCAISMRPGWHGGWLCGAAAGLLGYGIGPPAPHGTEWYLVPPRDWFAAVPVSWDSCHVFFGVAAFAGLAGAVVTRLPRRAVFAVALGWAAFHFAGILSAITSPPPTPWLADQYWKRVSKEYLQFSYMNNAYQFYSPDPGPACEVWVCLHYTQPGAGNDPDAPRECRWVMLPKRKDHYQDPLGLTFYRRLALTENLAQYVGPNYVPLAVEQHAVLARRERAVSDGFIPRLRWPDDQERRVPNELVTRHILPSFARHLASAHPLDGWELKSMKVYRVLHMITTLPQFRGYDPNYGERVAGMSPYNPTLYLPYFQGEFDREGNLLDPTDPLLYWLVPITNDRQLPASRAEYRQGGGFSHYFTDYVSRHAGCPRPTEEHSP